MTGETAVMRGEIRRTLALLAIVLALALAIFVGRSVAPAPARAQSGGLTSISQLLCPIITPIADATAGIPGVGQTTATLKGLVCNLGLLEFRFYTVWEGPGGERIERTYDTIVGLPRTMNVDQKGGADLIGTIAPSGTGLSLQIQRYPGQTAPLPVSVEALIKDPTGGGVGGDTIAFGYDQLDDRAPQSFKTKLGLEGLISPSGDPVIDVDITQTNPGDDTDLIASIFNGPPDARVDQTAGRAEFENSFTELGLELTLGDPLVAELTTNVTGPLRAFLLLEDGADETNFSAEIQDLPSAMTITAGQSDPRIVYTGTDAGGNPQAINHLILAGTSTQPFFSRADNLAGRIDHLPSGTEFNLDQTSNTVGLTSTQPIGSIELFAGSEPEQAGDLPPAGQMGARLVDRTGDPFVIGARVLGLSNLSAALAGPYTVHAETAGGPFILEALLEDLEATAEILDLPTTLDLSADLDTGAFTYDGSAEIGEIDIDLLSDTPLFGNANQVSALLLGIPTAFDLSITPGLSDFEFAAGPGEAIDTIEVMAKSAGATDESGLIPADRDGLVLRDLAETFLFGRVSQLERVAFTRDPLEAEVELGGGRAFNADAILDQGTDPDLDVEAMVENLPTFLSLGIGDDGTGGTEITYDTNNIVNRVFVRAEGLGLLPGAEPLVGEINTLPQDFTISLPASGPVATLNVPVGQIGKVRVGAGSQGLPAFAGDDNLTYRDLPGNFGISGRLSAIRSFSLGLDPVALALGLSNLASERLPIDLDAEIQATASDPVQDITARLDEPSANTTLNLVTADGQPTELDYTGMSVINNIDLHAENLAGLPLIDGHLASIPTALSVCFDPGTGCQRPNPHDIGRQQTSIISLDIDDLGSSPDGSPLTLTSADIVTEPGADPIEIRDIRLHELGVDIGLHPDFGFPSNTFGHVFIDTDNRDFSIDRVTYDPIERFAIGTTGDPAKAQDRLLNINGTDFCLGIPCGINTQTRGTFDCGGQRVLDVSVPVLGTINVLDLPIIGQVVPLCSS